MKKSNLSLYVLHITWLLMWVFTFSFLQFVCEVKTYSVYAFIGAIFGMMFTILFEIIDHKD
jgi:hypothetical protein